MIGWGVIGVGVGQSVGGLVMGEFVIGEGVVGATHESKMLHGLPLNVVWQHSYEDEKDCC